MRVWLQICLISKSQLSTFDIRIRTIGADFGIKQQSDSGVIGASVACYYAILLDRCAPVFNHSTPVLSPFHTNWQCLAMYKWPTILGTSPMFRRTSPVHHYNFASHCRPSWTFRRAWRFFFGMLEKLWRQPQHWKKALRSIRYHFANHLHAVAAVRQCVVTNLSVHSLTRWWRCTGKSLRPYRDASRSSANCWRCGRQCFVMRLSTIASSRDRVVTKSRYVRLCVATGAQ